MSSDPTTWGVQPTGFYAPTTTEIQDDLKAKLRAFVDPNLDLDDDSPEGQQIGVYARQHALAWEGLRIVHDGMNPDNADDNLLDTQAKLSGTVREGPRPTVVLASCTLMNGTTLQADVAIAAVANHPDQQFTPEADFTAPADGTYDVSMKCLTLGPIPVAANSLTVISSPVTGWTAVTNTAAGVTGSLEMTDTQLRLLREQELARTGTSTAEALRADILALGSKVRSCTVLANVTNVTDGNGTPAHSVAPIVYHAPDLDLTLLGTAIYEGKPAGIPSYGTTTITFTDAEGVLRVEHYTPVETVPIYLALTITTNTDYVGDTQFKADLAAALTAQAVDGGTVYVTHVLAAAVAIGGVVDVTVLLLDTDNPPTGSVNIPMTTHALATFSTDNIVVTS